MDPGPLLRELIAGGWKVFVVIFLVALTIVLAFEVYPATFPEPITGTRATAKLVALASGIVLLCYGLSYLFKKATEWLSNDGIPTQRALLVGWKNLDQAQRNQLTHVFQTQTRDFGWDRGNVRWFEELKEKGYVEFVSYSVYISGDPMPYRVTTNAWKAMEELHKSGKLSS